MPKKQIEDDEDIIEIEEFSEPKQGKSVQKQNTDKKAKSASGIRSKPTKKVPSPPENEDGRAEIEDEFEEEEEDHAQAWKEPVKKSKHKNVTKPISEKRLEILKKGREVAAANRAKKKEEQIAKLKKELWEDFNGKVESKTEMESKKKNAQSKEPPKPLSTKSERLVPLEQPNQAQEIISKMRERSSFEFVPTGRPLKNFIKIK